MNPNPVSAIVDFQDKVSADIDRFKGELTHPVIFREGRLLNMETVARVQDSTH